MALASNNYLNQALDALNASGTPTNLATHVSLHTATTGTTGASEVSGGGYARQACSWNSAASAAKTNSTALTFTTSGATANTHVGTWSASTAGTFGIGAALASSVTAASITVAAGAISIGAS